MIRWNGCTAILPDRLLRPANGRAGFRIRFAIVMKLLAKTAEERYQTAAGVEADLRRCLAEWQSTAASTIPAGRARHVGPVADSGAALRAGARDCHSARVF